MMVTMQFLYLVLCASFAHAEFYEDRRCSCVCPTINFDANNSKEIKSVYQDNHVSPEECNCNDMVLPRVANKFNGSLLMFCIQCDCRFETRNTTVVMIVVISLLVIITVLIMYMVCLNLLENIIRHRKTVINNQRHGNEEQHLGLLNRLDTSDEEN